MYMHGLIRDRLEDYLRRAPGKKIPPEFEEHLRQCADCRVEVSWMQEQSQLLRALAPPRGADLDPGAGFYARVMSRIEVQQAPSIWAAFLDPIFGKRLVATSVALATLMAGYLAFSERGVVPGPVARENDAETIIAVDNHPPGLGQNRGRDRDTILVTLATYRE